MKLSACLTVHSRMPEVSRSVADSLLLPGNRPDEVVVVLDRTPRSLMRATVDAYSRLDDYGIKVLLVPLRGVDGWRCPAIAWNAAFSAASGSVLACWSSETILASGSFDALRELLSTRQRIIFGAVRCSCRPGGHAVEADGSPTGNTLSSYVRPNPVGFLWAGHRSLIRAVDGYDRAFDDGIGYEDADFFLRLWDLGAEFEFNDRVAGLHICHDQPKFKQEPDGLERTKHNIELFLERYGTLDAWTRRARTVQESTGSLVWLHEADDVPHKEFP